MAQPFGGIDDLIRRLAAGTAGDAATDRARRAAARLLQSPEIEDVLSRAGRKANVLGLRPTGISGAGSERLVVGMRGDGDAPPMVLKIGDRSGFDLPDVPGVAAYQGVYRGDSLGFGLQRMADSVYRGADADLWDEAADRLARSLAARGYAWGDGQKYNVGLFSDGGVAAIDGSFTRTPAVPEWWGYGSEGDAIRDLLAPAEMIRRRQVVD